MRAPLKYLAPLIVLPFLACDGSPLEPDTEQAATELVQPAADPLLFSLPPADSRNRCGMQRDYAPTDGDQAGPCPNLEAEREQPPTDDTRGKGAGGEGNGWGGNKN